MTKSAPTLSTKVIVGALALLAPVLVVELALRGAGYDPLGATLGRTSLVRPSSRPDLGYELVPNARGAGWGTAVEVNSLGLRGPEPRSTGEARIACLGDSVTFGNNLAFEDTWPRALERELARQGQKVETLNLALGGYDTVQELAALEEKGLALAPRHVVLAFCVNDLGVVSMSMETSFQPGDEENPLYLSRIAQWFHVKAVDKAQRRALYERNREASYARLFADEIDALPGTPDFQDELASLKSAVAGAPAADHDLATRRIPARWYASEARLGRLEHAFARLERLAGQRGFAVTLLLVPYLEDDALIERGYGLVRALALAHGFAVVDPTSEFHRRGLAELRVLAEDPVHPDAEGHALLARALAPVVGAALTSAPTD